jgi:hypothetical protein
MNKKRPNLVQCALNAVREHPERHQIAAFQVQKSPLKAGLGRTISPALAASLLPDNVPA